VMNATLPLSLGQIWATICLRARLFVCMIVASTASYFTVRVCRVPLIPLLECAYLTTWGAEAHTY
jgi:hypothetical protein